MSVSFLTHLIPLYLLSWFSPRGVVVVVPPPPGVVDKDNDNDNGGDREDLSIDIIIFV